MNTADLAASVQHAQDQGWKVVEDRVEGATHSVGLRRAAHERISLTAWSELAQGGCGRVHALHGDIATGLVSRRQISREWNSRITQNELDELLVQVEYTNNSGHLLKVAEGEFNQYWETASNYTVHRTHPGAYPIELVTADYQRIREGDRPYYAIARVPTTEVRQHYVNRVFTASSSHDEELDRPSSYLWGVYAYRIPHEADSALYQVVPA